METININGKEYTESEFYKLLDVRDFVDERGLLIAEDIKSDVFDSINNFPRHEPEPPTVRPMSELPEVNVFVNILIEHDTKFWGDGFICLNRVELRYLGQDLWKQKDYKSDIGVKALGWLPKEALPNPNDIKL